MIHIGIWRYCHCENRTGKIISAGIIAAGVLVITGVFAIDAVNCKGNPYQENIGKYYSEECKPLVLSGGNAAGEMNIINCHETILQVDAAEYDNAISSYRKFLSKQQGGVSD
ncbi:hypothetical protein [Morganella sp. EGD-HP17]|uniref:hypothetical protein n=1 Tax=Morganella sp. EGD-HP17 TaxID=1435146 RepID=UPI000451D594|nr:hypothetical protein [Morganella sp. EGD-HP17]ETO41113.1 hypothetical protein X965_14640 [Morganella sp. EGD-HP17]